MSQREVYIKHFKRYTKGDLNVKDYCQKHSLPQSTFYYYARKLRFLPKKRQWESGIVPVRSPRNAQHRAYEVMRTGSLKCDSACVWSDVCVQRDQADGSECIVLQSYLDDLYDNIVSQRLHCSPTSWTEL
jgi:hypothetical protein